MSTCIASPPNVKAISPKMAAQARGAVSLNLRDREATLVFMPCGLAEVRNLLCLPRKPSVTSPPTCALKRDSTHCYGPVASQVLMHIAQRQSRASASREVV